VAKLNSTRRCSSIKKKLFDNADAELTLKLLKITPKEKELEVHRRDSEFLKQFITTAKKQSPQ
jgi:hypothetical protein